VIHAARIRGKQQSTTVPVRPEGLEEVGELDPGPGQVDGEGEDHNGRSSGDDGDPSSFRLHGNYRGPGTVALREGVVDGEEAEMGGAGADVPFCPCAWKALRRSL
jgi:hypothetical protein